MLLKNDRKNSMSDYEVVINTMVAFALLSFHDFQMTTKINNETAKATFRL